MIVTTPINEHMARAIVCVQSFCKKKCQNSHMYIRMFVLKETEAFSHISSRRMIYRLENAQNFMEFLLQKKFFFDSLYLYLEHFTE